MLPNSNLTTGGGEVKKDFEPLPRDPALSVAFLEGLGFEFFKFGATLKTRLRGDERTPSACVNKDGSIHDFGDGWHGTAIDVAVRYCGMSVSDAVRRYREVARLPLPEKIHSGFVAAAAGDGERREINAETVAYFKRLAYDNQSEFWTLVRAALPACNERQQREIVGRFDLGYSKKSNRLIMPIYDGAGAVVNLWKYCPNPPQFNDKITGEPFTPPKVMFERGYARRLFNRAGLTEKNVGDVVTICEGEKDALNAVGNGILAVSFGGAHCLGTDEDLAVFKGRRVFVAYDYDEAGRTGAAKIAAALQKAGAEVTGIIDWMRHVSVKLDAQTARASVKKGFDMTDWLVLKKAENAR